MDNSHYRLTIDALRHQITSLQDKGNQNLELLPPYTEVAREQGCTMGQLALAWLLARAPHVVPIPGTTRIDHLRENLGALDVRLSPATVDRLDGIINTQTVSGPRYNAATLPEIDTEEI